MQQFFPRYYHGRRPKNIRAGSSPRPGTGLGGLGASLPTRPIVLAGAPYPTRGFRLHRYEPVCLCFLTETFGRVMTTRQGISLPLDRQSYGRRLLGILFEAQPLLFTFQHRADVRHYTSFYNLAMSCVFIKQSFPPDMLRRRGPSPS